MIPRREAYGKMRIGQQVEARVAGVKPDGKLDLSVRSRIPEQMDKDAELLLARLEQAAEDFVLRISRRRRTFDGSLI